MASLTNVWFPPDKSPLLRSAIEHYQFDGPAAFFRLCGLMLIEHYERGDHLSLPLEFSLYASQENSPKTSNNATQTKTVKV